MISLYYYNYVLEARVHPFTTLLILIWEQCCGCGAIWTFGKEDRFYPKSVDPLDQGKKTLKEMSECCTKYVKLIF